MSGELAEVAMFTLLISGFQDAPVTQGKTVRHCAKVMLTPGMMMTLGVTSLTASLLDIKPYFHLQIVPHMTKYHQVSSFSPIRGTSLAMTHTSDRTRV